MTLRSDCFHKPSDSAACTLVQSNSNWVSLLLPPPHIVMNSFLLYQRRNLCSADFLECQRARQVEDWAVVKLGCLSEIRGEENLRKKMEKLYSWWWYFLSRTSTRWRLFLELDRSYWY